MATVAGDRFFGKRRGPVLVKRSGHRQRPAGMTQETFDCYWPRETRRGILFVTGRHAISPVRIQADRRLKKMIAYARQVARCVDAGSDDVIDPVIRVLPIVLHALIDCGAAGSHQKSRAGFGVIVFAIELSHRGPQRAAHRVPLVARHFPGVAWRAGMREQDSLNREEQNSRAGPHIRRV